VIRPALLACLAALAIPATARGQSAYTCGTGAIAEVRVVTETVTREHAVSRLHEARETGARVDNLERHVAYIIAVQLGDVLYTSGSTHDPFGTLDPTRLVNGERVGVCVDGVQMILERPDGKDYRAKVARTAPAPDGPHGTR
jgi:hypothetical protein